MKKKVDKRGKPPLNLEKRNKIIEKEELETIFARDEEDPKKKESQHPKYTQKLESNFPSPNLNIAL